jgi:glyoxylase-like metal-dependent hydrolase (beta-lactamase superfamily II)
MAAVEIAPAVACVQDTCNVYVLRDGADAVLVDFGSGGVLDELDGLGIERVTDILLTHHHRDQLQGLARAGAAGIRIWAPPYDAPYVRDIDEHWQSRPLDIDYDLRQDRFSLLESVPIAGTVQEYRSVRFGSFDIETLPTPGHTVGSVTYLVELDGRRLAFTGDLVFDGGKLWSLAATQWSYSGVEGQESTIVSLAELAKRAPELLLPSHGDPIHDPAATMVSARSRLGELISLRQVGEWGLEDRLETPYRVLTEHLWRNRTTFANSYVLLSETGSALGIDFGYDMATWRRPLLWSLADLKLDAVIATHFHDDHVAGLNLVREVAGTEVWVPENFVQILEQPHRYDLPCIWPEPTKADRVLALGETVKWNEYDITVHPLPGHTLYAAALEFEVDGRRVLVTGDQYGLEGKRPILNYQYRNRFSRRDFVETAQLLRAVRPQLLLGGHWHPREVDEELIAEAERDAERLAELHDELLPEEGFDEAGFGAWIEPYRPSVAPGEALELDVTAFNPFEHDAELVVSLVVPPGWSASPSSLTEYADARAYVTLRFVVQPAAAEVRRARVAADLTVDGVRFGQQAEALVDVR